MYALRDDCEDDKDEEKLKLLKGRAFTPGDKSPTLVEPSIQNARFNIFKFNNRPRPVDPKKILIITCFSEFGCETIGLMYCIPRFIQLNPGMYVICVGWFGREYLYRHLVDEYWELDEEFQWLREYTQAFVHTSKNIDKIEKNLSKIGKVLPCKYMGNICLGNTCLKCNHFWGDSKYAKECPKCQNTNLQRAILSDIPHYKKFAINIPKPSKAKLEEAKKYLLPNAVGVFGRGRKCYGRNLTPDFYIKLINLLRDLNYNPIWLGEKQSTQPCPVEDIVDFSRMPESRDLELTLAITAQLEFTVQFWTASTRLAAITGTPFILFESPDQLVGQGQEGLRLELTTDKDKKKIVLAHFLRILQNPDRGIELVRQAIEEIKVGNWCDIIGMVENPNVVRIMQQNYEAR